MKGLVLVAKGGTTLSSQSTQALNAAAISRGGDRFDSSTPKTFCTAKVITFDGDEDSLSRAVSSDLLIAML